LGEKSGGGNGGAYLTDSEFARRYNVNGPAPVNPEVFSAVTDSWMPELQFPVTFDHYARLPRNAAYRYEYLDGRACLSPRPRHYHALLELRPMAKPAGERFGPVTVHDFDGLVPLFARAFRHIQPFGSLDDETRREAARQALERTRTGGDGPWIQPASFLMRDDGGLAGAVFVTLLPDSDPCAWDSYQWPEPPPAECVERCLGRPHLTWIFVAPGSAGEGRGSALLACAVNQLISMGYTQMLSTFMLGNDSSLLWHWRNGFRLLPYPGSKRLPVDPSGWQHKSPSP
jgi:GNAT superfamily N-acetyltransferase